MIHQHLQPTYLISFLVMTIVFCQQIHGEEILHRNPPRNAIPTRVDIETNKTGLGPGTIMTQYVLARVKSDEDMDPDLGQPGVLNEVKTFFEEPRSGFSAVNGAELNTKTGFYEIRGMARFSFVMPDTVNELLPDSDFNPLMHGATVDATFIHNTDRHWVEVKATNLTTQLNLLKRKPAFPVPVILVNGSNCFIGLTPIFSNTEPRPFSGVRLANTVPVTDEEKSAYRPIVPRPKKTWLCLESEKPEPKPLFATISIRGGILPISDNDIFLSFADIGDGGARVATIQNMRVGESGSILVWVKDSFEINEDAFFDFATSIAGVINFTCAESFQADILDGGMPPDIFRWELGTFGPATIAIGGQEVSEMDASAGVTGTGILPSQTTGNALEDALHDSANLTTAFLFGKIEFEVVGSGSTCVKFTDTTVISDGVEIHPTFGSVTINADPAPGSNWRRKLRWSR